MNDAQTILQIHIRITDILETKSTDVVSKMILFDGYCDCPEFQGDILPGAVDTQQVYTDGTSTLSAHYMMKGKDSEGKECMLFIENNAAVGAGEVLVTQPMIRIDSRCLKWLETGKLFGEIVTENGELIIFIRKWKEK